VIEALVFRAFDSAAGVDCVASLFVLAGAAALAGFARELGLSRSKLCCPLSADRQATGSAA